MPYNAGNPMWPWGYQTTAASTASTIQLTVWANWVNQTTAATSISNNLAYRADIWHHWNTNGYFHQSQQNQQNLRYPAYVAPPPPTPEQLAAREEQQERYTKEREARRILTLDADRRAKALLLDHLNDEQKRDYAEKQHFDVEVDGKTYRIQPGTHGNVYELEKVEGREMTIRRFCIPSRVPGMPEADVHLSQKLMIEGAMDEFERIANITPYHPRAERDPIRI